MTLEDNEVIPTIGRDHEIKEILQHIQRGTNILITGPLGIGKMPLIRKIYSLCPNPSVLLRPGTTKTHAVYLAERVHSITGLILPIEILPPSKLAFARHYGTIFWHDIKRTMSRLPADRLIEIVIVTLAARHLKITIFIETLEIPPTQAIVIAKLFDVAQIIAAKHDTNHRNKIQQLNWHFGYKIGIKPLPLVYCEQIAREVLQKYPVRFSHQNLEAPFIRHVARESNGVPLAILEMIVAAATQERITPAKIPSITNDSSDLYLDMTPFAIICLFLLIAMRYIYRGMGESEFVMITGVASVLFMALRMVLYMTRK